MSDRNGHSPSHDDGQDRNLELRNELVEIAGDEKILFLDGFDGAIVGLCEVHGEPPRVAYSVDAILTILQENSDMDEPEAIEFFEFNIAGSYVGPYTPALLYSAPGKRVQFEVGDEDDGELE